MSAPTIRPYSARTQARPAHLAEWQLPPSWRWAGDGVWADAYRHSQEVIDKLGRSVCLVTTPDEACLPWLEAEARGLAHRSHPSIPTTYHFWDRNPNVSWGPGYLRRWVSGERVSARLEREGVGDLRYALSLLRAMGSTLAYLHGAGDVHGALSPDMVWTAPSGRFWLLGWQWAVPRDVLPPGVRPDPNAGPTPPEWHLDGRYDWLPSAATDQWQLGATVWTTLAGEPPPTADRPPLTLVCPECPPSIAELIERMIASSAADRFPSVTAVLRELDRITGVRTFIGGHQTSAGPVLAAVPLERMTLEDKVRWALGEDYRVVTQLGAGTFGSVWRVRDLSLGRDVALKVLHPHVAGDTAAVARFRREAQLAAQLQHPGIVPVYDWDTRAGIAWYTTELAEQGSLADVIERAGPRPMAEVAARLDEVQGGLAAAHAAGITHRDLKPENILVDRWGRWRLADFGVAHAVGDRPRGTGTTGTPAFAAPEQLLGEPVGAPADGYAMAAIAYFALTGRIPFPVVDARAQVGAQLREAVDYTAIPPALVPWFRRALAPEPSGRFSSVSAMREAWWVAAEMALRVAPAAADQQPAPAPNAEPQPRHAASRLWTRLRQRMRPV